MDIELAKKNLAIKITGYLADYKRFARECLGFKDMNWKHDELCNFLQYSGKKFMLVLMPRYSFKSCLVTQGFGLWNLVRNPNLRILIYSDSATKAQGFLSGMKNQIQGNAPDSRFKEFWGDWSTSSKDGKWNESQITVGARTVAHVEPSVETGGIETSMVGRHYDLIIFDDIVSDLNVTTKAQMDKVYDCYKKSLSLLKPGGQVIVVGTRWHFGDAYGHMINDNPGKFGVFLVDAEEKNVNGKLIFEDVGLTRGFLDQQKQEQGSYIYSCLYRNNPISDEEAIFKQDKFEFYDDVDPEGLFVTCALDPAGEGKDFTAMTVCGTDKDMNIYILDVFQDHLKPNQIVDKIIALNYKWKFDKFGVETNFFRGMLEKEIKRAIEVERKNINFKLFGMEEFTSTARRGEGKYNRVMALQPYHERGALLFRGQGLVSLKGAWSDLSYQMMQITPNHWPEHDDLIDSLAFNLNLVRPGGSVERKVRAPQYSAAWLEEQAYEEMLRLNKHVPRRYRQTMELVFN